MNSQLTALIEDNKQAPEHRVGIHLLINLFIYKYFIFLV